METRWNIPNKGDSPNERNEAITREEQERTIQEIAAFRREWFNRFVPPEKRELARSNCFPKGESAPRGEGGDHLWHAFGWRYIECLEGPAAKTAFARRTENGAGDDGLLLYSEREETLLRLPAETALPALGPDMYVTDPAFRWTYATGDGGNMGPYFARR